MAYEESNGHVTDDITRVTRPQFDTFSAQYLENSCSLLFSNNC